jgi:hypothetical protein
MTNQNLPELHQQVERFLSDFQRLIELFPCTFKKHKQNTDTLLQLGYSYNHVVEALHALTPDHYYAGPKLDEYHGGNYWEFGMVLEGQMIYIKIKIHTNKGGTDIPVCYSFHISEFPMNNFPLAGIS